MCITQVQQTTETSCIKANREVQWGGNIDSATNRLQSDSSDTVDNAFQTSLRDENYVELIKSESKVPNHFYDDVSSINVRRNREYFNTNVKQESSTTSTGNPNLTKMCSGSKNTEAENNTILSGTLEELIHELVPRAHVENCPT